ncbi:hypothetical protein [Streptomyces erythrochromogenes]|jgi:hypothetical protein|uniref:hypothetical protein n=1 Tax=Streptomyces erythrochromogenes TaxID=285574 RepID=UPI002252EB06|nr:hypothetical protein [Streptomyces erythrochromogenes]MCX5588172.1 hypothetical protein [Streptomyces erythrochromogenes]
MSNLTPGQQATVRLARTALTTSHQMSLGSATDRELCHNIGRLEIALEQALRIVDDLTEGDQS